DQHVLMPLHERPLQQRPRLLHHLGRQTLQVQRLPVLLQRQPRIVQQPLHALVPPLLALPLRQQQQVLREAQPLLLRLPRRFLATGPERRQVQFLQTPLEQLFVVLALLHRRPPCRPTRRHTPPDPPPRPSLRSPAESARIDAPSLAPHRRWTARPHRASRPAPPPPPPRPAAPPGAGSASIPWPPAPAAAAAARRRPCGSGCWGTDRRDSGSRRT